MSQWSGALQELMATSVQPIPKDFISQDEAKKVLGVGSRSRVVERLSQLQALGLIERIYLRREINGVIRKRPFYKWLGKK